MNIAQLLPLLLLVVVFFLMTRSAKNKQKRTQNMRDSMQPGVGVRTIGGLYGTVKSVGDEAVLLEVEPGMHLTFGKNAVASVLDPEEYTRIVDGALGSALPDGFTADDVPEDASELTGYDLEDEAPGKLSLSKDSDDEEDEDSEVVDEDESDEDDEDTEDDEAVSETETDATENSSPDASEEGPATKK